MSVGFSVNGAGSKRFSFSAMDLSSIFFDKEVPYSLLLMKGNGKINYTDLGNNNGICKWRLLELEMEKRSSHYKVSHARFVLINRVMVYLKIYQIHAKCTLAAITLGVRDEAFKMLIS